MKEAATLKQKLNGILRLTSVLQVKVEYFSVRRRKKNITKQRPRICVTARTKEGWRSRHEFSDPTNYIMGVGNVLYCCNQIQKKLQPFSLKSSSCGFPFQFCFHPQIIFITKL